MKVSRFDLTPLVESLQQNTTVLVPNQRLCDAVLHSVANQQETVAWQTPAVFPIDIWLQKTWDRLANEGRSPYATLKILASTEELLFWQDIVEQSQEEIPLLNPDDTAGLAQQAYQLMRLWLDDGTTPDYLPPAASLPELRLFNRWARTFTARCRSAHSLTLADAAHILIRDFASGSILLNTPLVLLNFYRPPPLYLRLFQQLKTVSATSEIRTARPRRVPQARRYQFRDLDTEIQACAEWALGHCRADRDCHLGIIHGGDDRQLRAIHRRFSDLFAPMAVLNLAESPLIFNSTGLSESLSETDLVGQALGFLNLVNEEQDTAEFCRRLHSRQLVGWETEAESRLVLERVLRENLGTRCSLTELIRLMTREHQPGYCPILAQALVESRNLIRQSSRNAAHATWCSRFLAQLTILGLELNSGSAAIKDKRGWKEWQQALDILRTANPGDTRPTRQTAVARLRLICRHLTLRQPFRATSQVSLYNLDQAVGLEFTRVWFLGFDDQSLPAAPHPSPFLLHSLQNEASVPGCNADTQLSLARKAFDLVCRSTQDEICASFHRYHDDEEFRPSSLIKTLPVKDSPQSAPTPLNSRAMQDCGALALLPSTADRAIPLLPDERPGGGHAIISNQSSCPFRAFARHRLVALPLEDFRNGLDYRARGIAVHRIMERLFDEIKDHESLVSLSSETLRELIERNCLDALSYLARRYPEQMTPRFRQIELARLVTLVTDYLEQERLRPGFTVVETELRLEWQQGHLGLTFKIDRLDRLSDGSLAIIDYKTGRNAAVPRDLRSDRPEDMQLPVYTTACRSRPDGPVRAVGIARLSTGRPAISGLAASALFHPAAEIVTDDTDEDTAWESLSGHWLARTTALANEFVDGVARVAPVNGAATCRLCDLQPVCRIRQLDLLAAGEDSDTGDEAP